MILVISLPTSPKNPYLCLSKEQDEETIVGGLLLDLWVEDTKDSIELLILDDMINAIS